MLGDAAELYFMAKAAALGLIVSKPMQLKAAYDVVVEVGHKLYRVQVKSAAYLTVHNHYRFQTTRRSPAVRSYGPDEVDFIVGYVCPEDAWYIIPIAALEGRLGVDVHPKTRRGRFEQFRERWDLLLGESVSSSPSRHAPGNGKRRTKGRRQR
jgi:hypothetical protein